ncbi:DUF3231 family protein [Bacillus mesophilum]|uniref:DUF3231 family protein n=1 Tax=Bacillus mesophilum TaxID=1071718 RepID=A0A7V7RJZ8_9BACI|nr:DUF3231 family protein [Bacillus mesophilum]KAB2331374.1 DUF3231 family protein [Bacillus mesophilum]
MHTKLSSVEFGALWTTFQKKTMILRILDYLISTAEDQDARDLMSGLYEKLQPKVEEIKTLIKNEGAAIPEGFTDKDVNLKAPRLFENGFDIMFTRILKEVSMGMYVLHMTISYRQDIIELYKKLSEITQGYYDQFTAYLIKRDLLPRPNFTNLPNSITYIEDESYMTGSNFFGSRRPINTVEFGLMYHSVEVNNFAFQLLRGFSQCATDIEARKYFTKGVNISKEILQGIEKGLLHENIKVPAASGVTVTNSEIAPFSDRLMMFCTFLFGGFSLGGQGFSSTFILRDDVVAKNVVYGKDTFEYTREGAKLMMKKGWLEEPPKMDL